MSKRSFMRLAWVLGICLACAYFFMPLHKIRLGLDLKGGVHYELEVQEQEALQRDLEETRDILLDHFKDHSIPSAKIHLSPGVLRITGAPRGAINTKLSALRGYALSVDGEGLVLTQKPDYQKEIKTEANKRALLIIENRINQFGVVEPEITAGGAAGNRIIVELPGVTEADRDRIKGLLMTPGRLELRLLAKSSSTYFSSEAEALAHFGGTLPEGAELFPEPLVESSTNPSKPSGQAIHEPPQIRRWVLLESKVQFDGSAITQAQAAPSETGAHEVHFTLNAKGAEGNARVTEIASKEGRLFAFVLDKKVISILSAKEKIVGNAVQISGSFTADEANDLALKLRSGAMRASMKFLEERVVGPSLGSDSIRKGIGASLAGFSVIVSFMVLWYRWSGVNAIIALIVNIVVMLGLLGSFHATLTLPGIAGFALTVGMAVDANILIYERIKEEMASGKSPGQAIQAGFDRVFWTIVDSHVTQLFAALLLFIFGTGPVKGFAVSLCVGVAASLFTSIYISRFIYDWVLERRPLTPSISIGRFEVFKNTRIDFMRYKKAAVAISWGLILLCALIVKPWKPNDNPRIQLGMQFVGGTDMTIRFLGDMDAGSVRNALIQAGIQDASVVSYQHSDPTVREFSIKVKAPSSHGEAQGTPRPSDRIKQALSAMDPAGGERPALNLETVQGLTERLAQLDPLNLGGDANGRKDRYEALATRVMGTREHLPAGLFRGMKDLPSDLPASVHQQLEQQYRIGNVGVLKDENFSPSISGEWTRKTLAAVSWAMGAILVYVIFRFTTAFAVGGIIALIHDILMALGLFAIMGYEFNVPVVASFLTLMGYSMADTIVVFDRIRENLHKTEYRRVPLQRIINDSINQTLSRTILTSMSVLFVSLCLWLWGGPALRDLAFPLVVGVLTGTYSSIYIASPVAEWWQRHFGGKETLARAS